MNFKLLKLFLVILTFFTLPTLAKRPKKEKPPKEPRPELTQEQKQIIAANVAQVMGGICAIAQEPRNAHNVGSSIATMIQALINILVEKFARKNIDLNNTQNMEELQALIRDEMSKEITEIIITKKLFSIDRA